VFCFSIIGHLLFKSINKISYGDLLDSFWTQFSMLGTNNYPDEDLAVAD